MLDNLKKILNEDQDPKAIDKITEKLDNILMLGEEVGYIGVQKKPALTVLPDSIVVTNKRIIVCKPKNLGLSMSFIDYDWQDIVAPMIKENLLGSEFSFVTKTDITESIDYIPKNQARKLYTFAKEQLELSRQSKAFSKLESSIEEAEIISVEHTNFAKELEIISNQPSFIEDVDVEEVISFNEIVNQPNQLIETNEPKSLQELSKEELFEKLQNYKKLLDNGLILQGEYDALKKEIIKYL